jgi:hypothetical protein
MGASFTNLWAERAALIVPRTKRVPRYDKVSLGNKVDLAKVQLGDWAFLPAILSRRDLSLSVESCGRRL